MYWGIDSGSTSVNVLLLNDEKDILGYRIAESGCRPAETAEQLMRDICKENCLSIQNVPIISTGYGRRNIRNAQRTFTEVTCHAYGVQYLYPEAETVIDIGGQDCKVIYLSKDGGVDNFLMNDKCAAGTGRFLEVMARVLDCPIASLSQLAQQGEEVVPISNLCTVFAESEVISHLSAGVSQANVAAGAIASIATRITGMAGRVGVEPQVVMTGGGALNGALVEALSKSLGHPVCILDNPQVMGALGAAVFAWESAQKQHN